MKRIITAVLVCLLLVFAVLCSSCSELTTYQVFTRAQEKTKQLDSYACETSAKVTIESQGIEMSVPVNYNIQVEGLLSETPVYSCLMDVELLGVKMKINLYDDGVYVYLSAMGEKVKIKKENIAAVTDPMLLDFSKMGNRLISDFPEELFRDVTYTENEQGTRSLRLTLSPEQFDAYCEVLKDMIMADAATASWNLDGTTTDFRTENVDISMEINKDGYFSSYGVNTVVNILVTGDDGTETTTTMQVDINLKMIDPGTPVEVTAPADLDDYEEVEP